MALKNYRVTLSKPGLWSDTARTYQDVKVRAGSKERAGVIAAKRYGGTVEFVSVA